MNQKIKEMFTLQGRLNDATNGDGWLDGKTKEGKVINWDRAAYLETSELIESFPWKHWKAINQQPDMANAQIEVVDNWHFLMSSLLEVRHLLSDKDREYFDREFEVIFDNDEMLNSPYVSKSKEGFVINFDEDIQGLVDGMNREWTLGEHQKIDTFMKPFEAFAELALFSGHIKRLIKEEQYDKHSRIYYKTPLLELTFKELGAEDLDIRSITIFYLIYTFHFFVLAKAVKLDLDELYKIYLGKNLLNQFRQNNGYKEGTYIKIWNGEEDNVAMLRTIEEYPDGGYDEIYLIIEEIYRKL